MTRQEKAKLVELRNHFIERTEYFTGIARRTDASPQGAHYNRGNADGFIRARKKLEDLFDYLNLW